MIAKMVIIEVFERRLMNLNEARLTADFIHLPGWLET
jgi:hypothetical protein